MEFRQIRYFLEIQRAASFVKAAGNLGLTQPALSRQMALLERELGHSLLERGTRDVRLTPAGEKLLPYAVRLADLWREMQDCLKDPAHELRGEYSISSGGTVAAYVLPEILRKLRKKYPEITLRVYEGDAQETRESVLRGEVDLGILTGEASESGLVQKSFLTDRIVPVAMRDHPIFRKKKPPLSDLAGESFVFFPPASAIRRAVEKKLRSLRPRFVPRIGMELRTLQGVVRSIEAGLGPGFLSEFALTPKLRVLPFPELATEREFFLCYRRHHRAGLQLLVEELERHINRGPAA